MTRSFGRGVCVALFAVASACGSSKSASIFDEPPPGSDASTSDTGGSTTDTGSGGEDSSAVDTGGTTTDAVVDVPIGEPPPDEITLSNVCDKLAEAICAKPLETCCSSKGVAFNDKGCRDSVRSRCKEQVDDVNDGKGTFNAAAFGKCAAAWSTLATKCAVPILEFIRTYAPCHQLFPGTMTPGADGCADEGTIAAIGTDCKAVDGTFGNCRGDGRCEQLGVVGKDASCNIYGSTRSICDYGLVCQLTGGGSGSCKPQKATGAACNDHWECGFGNYCQRSSFGGSGKCAAGLTAGSTCSFDAQCASGDCNGGKCTSSDVIMAMPLYCNGVAG